MLRKLQKVSEVESAIHSVLVVDIDSVEVAFENSCLIKWALPQLRLLAFGFGRKAANAGCREDPH